jgi:hypothetical protein
MRQILQQLPARRNMELRTLREYGIYASGSNSLRMAPRRLYRLTAIGAEPPKGFKWTSHSLRKGAASASSGIGTLLHVVKYMGGWAKNNSMTEGKHIDPTMTPTPAAWRYFGWLVPTNSLH